MIDWILKRLEEGLNNEYYKRYYKKKNKIELHPANTNFDIIHIHPEDDFRIGGKVLSVIRKYN